MGAQPALRLLLNNFVLLGHSLKDKTGKYDVCKLVALCDFTEDLNVFADFHRCVPYIDIFSSSAIIDSGDTSVQFVTGGLSSCVTTFTGPVAVSDATESAAVIASGAGFGDKDVATSDWSGDSLAGSIEAGGSTRGSFLVSQDDALSETARDAATGVGLGDVAGAAFETVSTAAARVRGGAGAGIAGMSPWPGIHFHASRELLLIFASNCSL